LKHVPEELIERSFPEQVIVTPWQRVMVAEENPIIATVSRERLGQWMTEQALAAGVRIRTATRAIHLQDRQATLEAADGHRFTIGHEHLIGADGSNSMVRRWLGLPTALVGIGLHCMHPAVQPSMEWHLDPNLFGAGYGWIFPHRETSSIGAYGDSWSVSAKRLKQQLMSWTEKMGIRLDPQTIRAGLVNYDYRGVRFDRTWLVGDAAGLASGLTGEGIYPALISGQAVARMILDPNKTGQELARLAGKHQQHRQLVALASKGSWLCRGLMEAMVFLLRIKVVDFHSLEMAK
jgi:geranylgeranyl reductase